MAESHALRRNPNVVYRPMTTESEEKSSRAGISNMADTAADIAGSALYADRSTDRFLAGILNTVATADSFDTANTGTEHRPNMDRGRTPVP